MGGSKDADMSPFECGRRLLDPGSKSMSLDERLNMYFQDADLVPLLVQVHSILPACMRCPCNCSAACASRRPGCMLMMQDMSRFRCPMLRHLPTKALRDPCAPCRSSAL